MINRKQYRVGDVGDGENDEKEDKNARDLAFAGRLPSCRELLDSGASIDRIQEASRFVLVLR